MNSTCSVCFKEFCVPSHRALIAKYCSRQCYYQSRRVGHASKSQCKKCNRTFYHCPSKKRTFCSNKCRGLASRKESVKHPTGLRRWMSRRRQMNKCENCGYSDEPKILGIHHKDFDSRNNALSNLKLLCPNCHSLLHLRHTVQVIKH